MNILSLVLFACAGLMVVVSLSSMYATNVTFWKGTPRPGRSSSALRPSSSWPPL